MRSAGSLIAWRKSAPDPCSSAGVTILIATTRRRIKSHARFSAASRKLRLFEYAVWGAALPPSTQVQPIRDGFRIRIEQALDKKRRAIAAHRSQITDLIDDDCAGFRLTESDLARFDLPYEFFLESDP